MLVIAVLILASGTVYGSNKNNTQSANERSFWTRMEEEIFISIKGRI
ncbi:MAG: hypothetical protein PWP07_2341 [Epulopiscium sp.]|jgi:hypothetical protein|nr:hypothetical protein [Candidatus Epulonipiscium sp.]